MVIRDFNQQLGMDYKHTFPPIAKLATVRLTTSLAASKKWHLKQLDINDAFPHGYLNEEIYITPHLGYSKAAPGRVCKLKKSLYGLKQDFRQWNIELTKFLLSIGFIQSRNNHSLFIYTSGSTFTATLIYVNDILLTAPELSHVDFVKASLHSKFTIKNLGDALYFLGIELCKTNTGILLNQRKYICDILQKFDLSSCPSAHTSLPTNIKLSTMSFPTL